MANSNSTVVVNFFIQNRKAARALIRAASKIAEIAEEQPWNEDAKEAAKALTYAIKHLEVRIEK